MNERYCKKCGCRMMHMGLRGAENFGFLFSSDSKYDYKTGKRKMREWYACPNRPEGFWAFLDFFADVSHDSYALGDIVLLDK